MVVDPTNLDADDAALANPTGPTGPTEPTGLTGPSGLTGLDGRTAALGVILLVAVGALVATASGPTLLMASATVGLLVALMVIRRPAGWLSPLGLPLLYLVVVHTLPLLMAERWFFADRPVTLINGLVGRFMADEPTTRALALLLVGYLAGAAALWKGILPTRQLRARFDQPPSAKVLSQLRLVGLATLWLAIGLQLLYVYRNGFSRFAPTAFDRELTSMGRILILAGVACIVIATSRPSKLGHAQQLETWLCALVFGLAVAWGSRAALLAPGLLLAFVFSIRRQGSRAALWVGGTVAIVALVLVAETRIQGTDNLSGFTPERAIERAIRDINAPTYLTYYTLQYIPPDERSGGGTYVAAVPYLLPSVAIEPIGLDLAPLATARYREAIDFTRADRGFGFGLAAEAVMNFGPLGALGAGAALGLLCSAAYRWMVHPSASVARRWLYPLIFASIPWIVRSDVLQGFKPIVYAIVAVAIASTVRSSGSGPGSGPGSGSGSHDARPAPVSAGAPGRSPGRAE